jgi:hypothetical protein
MFLHSHMSIYYPITKNKHWRFSTNFWRFWFSITNEQVFNQLLKISIYKSSNQTNLSHFSCKLNTSFCVSLWQRCTISKKTIIFHGGNRKKEKLEDLPSLETMNQHRWNRWREGWRGGMEQGSPTFNKQWHLTFQVIRTLLSDITRCCWVFINTKYRLFVLYSLWNPEIHARPGTMKSELWLDLLEDTDIRWLQCPCYNAPATSRKNEPEVDPSESKGRKRTSSRRRGRSRRRCPRRVPTAELGGDAAEELRHHVGVLVQRLRSGSALCFSTVPEEYRLSAHKNYGAPIHELHSTRIHLHGTWRKYVVPGGGEDAGTFSCKYSKLWQHLFATEFWAHHIWLAQSGLISPVGSDLMKAIYL